MPAKKKAPAKRKAPAKKKAPAKRKAPATKKAPAKRKAPATKKAPAKAAKAPAKTKAPARRSSGGQAVRAGGQRVQVFNSGLEVWLYDDANLAAIRDAASQEDPGEGGMPGGFARSTRAGLVVGYSLYQDDGLDVEVHVGPAFSQDELAPGRWLEPQGARLRLPSGRLCLESNDASRLGPERPGEAGAVVEVPPGDYRLTLLRVDHEALDREGIDWMGPQELVLLTPGAKASDAAQDLLPFQQRRDTTWVGQYTLEGTTARARAWFGDYWDTFFVNLDGAACARLGLEPGRYFRTTCPEAGLTLVSAFARSWDEGRRLPPPSNVPLDEYGYAALSRPQDWNQEEAIFCRRERATTRAEDAIQNLWLPATVEVLDPVAHPPQAAQTDGGPIDLRAQTYFDSGFLTIVLSDLLPGVDDLDALPLADAIDRVDADLARLGFTPLGDVGWRRDDGVSLQELGARLYAGDPRAFAAVLAAEACFELVFLSQLPEGGWVVTGLADELERRVPRATANGPRVQLTSVDEPIARIWAQHQEALAGEAPTPAPGDLIGCAAALGRFLELASER